MLERRSLHWATMQEPVIARQITERFDHVLVDEYQDTNRLQASVLLALRPNGVAQNAPSRACHGRTEA